MTPFDEASHVMVSLPLCHLILAIVKEHLQLWGEVPTAQQLQAKLQQPGL